MAYTAGNVMDTAAALLNDVAKSLFTYTFQLPYLRLAQTELEQELILSEVSLQLQVSANISVPANTTTLALPADFFLPISLEERPATSSSDNDFVPMVERAFDPSQDKNTTLGVYDFRNNNINFIGATTANTVRLRYWRILTAVVDQTTNEEVNGGMNFLARRTAAICGSVLGGPMWGPRALELNAEARMDLDRLIALFVKDTQNNRTRRRPFRVMTR